MCNSLFFLSPTPTRILQIPPLPWYCFTYCLAIHLSKIYLSPRSLLAQANPQQESSLITRLTHSSKASASNIARHVLNQLLQPPLTSHLLREPSIINSPHHLLPLTSFKQLTMLKNHHLMLWSPVPKRNITMHYFYLLLLTLTSLNSFKFY